MISSLKTKSRITWVDSAKGISILLVVLLHARNELLLFSIGDSRLDTLVEVSANLRMPLFFAVAGLFAEKWIKVSWRRFLNEKAALLIWVLLLWQPIIFFYKILNHVFLDTLTTGVLIGEIGRVILSPIRPNGELWFLWALLAFFVIARITRNVPAKIQLAVSVFISACWMTLIEPLMSDAIFRALGSGWNGLFRYYFLFIGFSLFSKKILIYASRTPWYASISLFLLWLISAVASKYFAISDFATLFLLTMLGTFGGLGLAKIVSSLSIFEFLGQRTLQIYLAHSTFVTLITCSGVLIGLNLWAQNMVWIAMILLVGVAIIGSLILHRFTFLKYFYEQPSWFSVKSR